MQIVKKDSFRSQCSAINKTDDMFRVVVDMRRTEYPQFVTLVEENGSSHNTGSENLADDLDGALALCNGGEFDLGYTIISRVIGQLRAGA